MGVELVAASCPGSAAEVGAHWYDAFTLPDGRLVLVVGDVMGKGVAAAGMGRRRAALRALGRVSPLLPEAVEERPRPGLHGDRGTRPTMPMLVIC